MSDRFDIFIAITGVWRLSAVDSGLSTSRNRLKTSTYRKTREEIKTAFSRTHLMKHAGGMSTALMTDLYEVTMLDAALRSGVASRQATFEVFARRLPPGRGYGIVAGPGRLA